MGKAEESLTTRCSTRIRDAEMKAEVVEGQLQISKTERQKLEGKDEKLNHVHVSAHQTEPTPKLGAEWANAQLENF
ncbi:hypothetical protein N7481_007741 [Penicillium waksmanii]|uniref:uncharacterized protein n=1 Tax=Penicillium waksmanii TaxID=69791 RepID=UPI0025483E80|nr:uncharacterized protein N7481_007741 [Penicillium waksmanii]KAJ5980443.1 hypothetical protein N7481_007741 [Penicillium waksmanii]